MKNLLLILLVLSFQNIFAQSGLAPLTVQKIMRDPKWIGTSPSSPYWSSDSKYLLFNWNPEKAVSDSLYYITKENVVPQKASFSFQQTITSANSMVYNNARTFYVFSKDGDIFLTEVKTGKQRRITQTTEYESNPDFAFNDSKIVYSRNQNLYAWDIAGGLTTQLTNFKSGSAPAQPEARPSRARGRQQATETKKDAMNMQEKWLEKDQLENFDVLRTRKEKKDLADSINKLNSKPEDPKS